MNAIKTIAIVFLSSLYLTACGLDHEYTGLGESWSKDDQGSCDGDDPDTDPGVLDVDNLEGRLYRATSVAMTKPFGKTINRQLNEFFTDEIESEGLNILLKVTMHVGAELHFEVSNGTASAGEYQLGESSSMICSLNGATFKTLDPAELAFPASEDVLDPPSLPIKDLKLGGKFDPQGGSVGNGTLIGALTIEDARGIQVMGSDMASFLELLKIEPVLDLDGDSVLDAYQFEGVYEAVQVTEVGASDG